MSILFLNKNMVYGVNTGFHPDGIRVHSITQQSRTLPNFLGGQPILKWLHVEKKLFFAVQSTHIESVQFSDVVAEHLEWNDGENVLKTIDSFRDSNDVLNFIKVIRGHWIIRNHNWTSLSGQHLLQGIEWLLTNEKISRK